MAQLEALALQVQLEQLDLLETWVQLVEPAQQAQQDLQVHRVALVRWDLQEELGQQDLLDPLEVPDQLDLRVTLDPLDLKATPEVRARSVRQDLLDLLAPLVTLEQPNSDSIASMRHILLDCCIICHHRQCHL